MTTEALRKTLAALREGAPYKQAFEALLVDVTERRAEELMLLHNESRGGWVPLLRQASGTALFLGHPASGTITPMAAGGFEVVVCAADRDWLAFALARGADYVPGKTRAVLADASDGLPFADGSFDLVVVEANLARALGTWERAVEELARVARGELVLVADNRLAYKHSLGRRGEYDIPSPAGYVKRALAPPAGELTLAGYRRVLRRHFAHARSFSLYPDARDFSHVVGLDDGRPRLTVGPRERGNRLKFLAKKAGLFPLLTPSFAILADRKGGEARIERTLHALAERLGEPRPRLEMLVATRSNSAVMHTAVAGTAESEEGGRWTLHVPLNPKKKWMMEHHFDFLCWIREHFPALPVPAPLFMGEIEGHWVSCERRLGGLSFPHLTGDREATRRTFLDVVDHFAELVVERDVPLDEQLYERMIGRRFRVVREKARVTATVERLERMEAQVRERILGKRIPLVLYHADMRSKHIQVRPDGRVVGYLDWGTSERSFLPYVDVMHMVTHQRKHEEGGPVGEPWRILRDRVELVEHEVEAIERYVGRLGLDEDVRSALELMLPVLVAGMAELHWDYSRPLWVHRQFGF